MNKSKNTIDEIVDKAAKAIAKEMWKPLYIICLTTVAIQLVFFFFKLGKDSTDPKNGRSGMRLHVDSETGVEYLSVKGGGIIIREK